MDKARHNHVSNKGWPGIFKNIERTKICFQKLYSYKAILNITQQKGSSTVLTTTRPYCRKFEHSIVHILQRKLII